VVGERWRWCSAMATWRLPISQMRLSDLYPCAPLSEVLPGQRMVMRNFDVTLTGPKSPDSLNPVMYRKLL